jgi:hypothetical protein
MNSPFLKDISGKILPGSIPRWLPPMVKSRYQKKKAVD